jgi:hypothetical protein
VDIPAADLDALGLRPLPPEISVVLADPLLRAAVGGLRQITAPVDELAGLQIRPDAVLIVENKEPALAWSDTTGLAIIHSLGNHLDVLARLPWLRHDRCWYWGDLDRHDQPASTLTMAESSALTALQLAGGKYLRTEQERIPIGDAERALDRARNSMRPNATEASAE